MTAEYVNWCCEELLRNTKLTKATVRAGAEDDSNLWIFTLECEIGHVKKALSYAALRTKHQEMRDPSLFYNELETMARAVVDVAEEDYAR